MNKAIYAFTATWCGPCKMIKPLLAQLEKEEDILVEHYDVDQNRDVFTKYNVTSVPTLIYVDENGIYARTSGYLPKQKILDTYRGV